MSRKLLLSSIAIAATATMLGVGTFAKFSDSENSAINTVTAGKMDLVVVPGGTQYQGFAVTGAVPGQASFTGLDQWGGPINGSQTKYVSLDNDGDVAGMVTVKVVMDSNTENGLAEPEPAWDTEAQGELADNLLIWIDGIGSIQGVSLAALQSMAPAQWHTLLPHTPSGDAVLSINWSIPVGAGNEIMTDGVSFHLEFTLEQV